MKTYDVFIYDRKYYMVIGRGNGKLVCTDGSGRAEYIDEAMFKNNSTFIANIMDNSSAVHLLEKK